MKNKFFNHGHVNMMIVSEPVHDFSALLSKILMYTQRLKNSIFKEFFFSFSNCLKFIRVLF